MRMILVTLTDTRDRDAVRTGITSTRKNYYTGLIETSKKHFYGRAAAELSFSDLVLGTFTAAQRPVRVFVLAIVEA
jgi:hypothetical protein